MTLAKKHFTSIVTSLLLVFCSLSVCAAAGKSSNVWKDAKGSYAEESSAQYTNSRLQLKPLGNSCVLYDFNVMKGSEKEQTADNFSVAGVFLIGDNGVGKGTLLKGEKEVTLTFKKDGDKVLVTQEGKLALSVKGTYLFGNKSVDVSPNSAVAILEHLAPVTTSLNKYNRPYKLEYSEERKNGNLVEVKAINTKSKTMFARFLIANDLSAVYRQDNEKAVPLLIYGTDSNPKG